MQEKKTSLSYKIIIGVIRLLYPKFEAVGVENLPNEPVIIVSNHAQTNGPIACELYSPRMRYTWCVGEMMTLKEIPAYAFKDFWSQKPKYTHPFYKALSYLIAPLANIIFNNANTIAVRHDARIFSTFRKTLAKLHAGVDIVIFPEYDSPHNNVIYNFHDRFIDVAKLYHKKSGKEICFVPLYIAPKLGKMYYGKPIRYQASNSTDEERVRIRQYLMDEITSIATSLPTHTVIPYRNIPKKFYPKNRPLEVKTDEKTDS